MSIPETQQIPNAQEPQELLNSPEVIEDYESDEETIELEDDEFEDLNSQILSKRNMKGIPEDIDEHLETKKNKSEMKLHNENDSENEQNIKKYVPKTKKIKYKKYKRVEYNVDTIFDKAMKKAEIRKINLEEKDPFDDRYKDKFICDHIMRLKELEKTRICEKKSDEIYMRFKQNSENVNNKLVKKCQTLQEDMEKNCTFMPSLIKPNLDQRTPEQFVQAQIEFKNKVNKLNQMRLNEQLEKEKSMSSKKIINNHSEKIENGKNPNETTEDRIKKLAQNKRNFEEEMLARQENKEIKKLTKEQMQNISKRLWQEEEIFSQRKKQKIKEEEMKNTELSKLSKSSHSSNKLLLDRFSNIFEQEMLNNFNQKDNIQLNFDEYKKLLSAIGFMKDEKKEEQLLLESFHKYLKKNSEDDKVNSFSVLLFGLAVIGVYKGNNEEQKDKNQKNWAMIINHTFPEIDMQTYGFDYNFANNIRKNFIVFFINFSDSWKQKRDMQRYFKGI